MINDDEKLKNLYPFQYYTFSKLSNIEKSGFNFDDYSFRLEHDNELYFGNINGLICRHDMGYPLKLLKYLKEDPDTLRKRKITFLLPENYRDIIENLKGLRKFVLDIFDCPKFKEQITVKTYKIDNSDIINKTEELSTMPKFDVCIGNPPFAGKGNPLYVRILEICNKISKNVVWICPTQWVKNYKDSAYLNNVKTNTCKNLIAHYHVSNPFNDAIVANEIGIYVFGNATQYEDYNEIRWERFSNIDLAKSICKKFENYEDNISNHNTIDLKLPFYVKASHVRGNQDLNSNKPKWDWTTLFGKEQHSDFSKKILPRWNFWNFNTVNECKNFIASTELDICMFALYICKINNNNSEGAMELMPWFDDYTHEWTEEMIAQELGLTDGEVKYIHEEMKNFGWKAAPQK